MLEPFISLFGLRWTNQPRLNSLPDGITREFISTSSQNQELELLVATPISSSLRTKTSKTDGPPILFLHGGFGSAAVYTPFMTYCSKNYHSKSSTYAISMRGHGASYTPGYLKMVYGTSLQDLASDLVYAVERITKLEGQVPLILAHSSGGGLLQYTLANNLLRHKIPGLILLDAVPNFGNLQVYANWAKHDPWFMLRMLLHLNHVASPLSSVSLVHGAFFGSKFPAEDKKKGGAMTREFMNCMAPYESLLWPLQMMHGLWAWITGSKEKWLNTKDVLHGVDLDAKTGDQEMRANDKICIIIGSEDVLMDIPGQKRMAGEYRSSIQQLTTDKKIDWALPDQSRPAGREDTSDESRNGVRILVLPGGHHIQNDVCWEKAAEAVVDFAEQL